MRVVTFVRLIGAGLVVSCGSTATQPSDSIAGTYTATTFRITPTGQGALDVLAAGGALTITIAPNNATSGSLTIPASVTGGAPFSASMQGTASATGSVTTFAQAADSFVRDLSWGRTGTSFTVNNQVAGGASYTITLSKH